MIYIRTKAGRIHKAVRLDGRLLTDEGDNLDDAKGEHAEITLLELEQAEPGALCGRCWPATKPDAEQGE